AGAARARRRRAGKEPAARTVKKSCFPYKHTSYPWCRVFSASPAVFDKRTGLPRTLMETPKGLMPCAQHCACPPSSGKPYLAQVVPPVALVREQRFAPAQAGGAT